MAEPGLGPQAAQAPNLHSHEDRVDAEGPEQQDVMDKLGPQERGPAPISP